MRLFGKQIEGPQFYGIQEQTGGDRNHSQQEFFFRANPSGNTVTLIEAIPIPMIDLICKNTKTPANNI